MTRFSISAPARWLMALGVLAAASGLAPWSESPGKKSTVVAVKKVPFVPSFFTVASAQALPTKVCSKKPVIGETMTYAMNSSSATDSTSFVHPITNLPSILNFAGLTGPAGLFASAVSLPVGTYRTLNLVMDDVMTVQGTVTCDPDGAGPLTSVTCATGGSPDVTVPDVCVVDPAPAPAPVATRVTSSGGEISFSMPIAFSVTEGGNITLNITYNTDEGYALYDISVITGVAGTYKIVPNDITIMAATPAP